MAQSVSARPAHTRTNENKLSTDGGGSINGGKIDDTIANLSSSTKKMSSGAGFLTFEASLAFIQLKKPFTKAPILYHFDPECHIRIETDASGYTISRVLSQLITKKNLAD